MEYKSNEGNTVAIHKARDGVLRCETKMHENDIGNYGKQEKPENNIPTNKKKAVNERCDKGDKAQNGKQPQSDITLYIELHHLRSCTLDERKSGKEHKVGQFGHHSAIN